MNNYHVTFYYHASGMEHGPETHDYGVITASSKDAAIRFVLKHNFPNERDDWGFIGGCLTAKLVK